MQNSREFEVCYHVVIIDNGSTNWTISPSKIEINHYYNDKNLNLREILYKLNNIAKKSAFSTVVGKDNLSCA